MADSTRPVLWRTARTLWCLPLVVVVPVFIAVREFVPNLAHGSIADGFRKFNIFLETMVPVTGICWATAFCLTVASNPPQLTRRRLYTTVGLIFLALLVILLCA